MNPYPIDLPHPEVVGSGQLIHACASLTGDWVNGVTWVQYPESPPTLAPFECGTSGYAGEISGDTVASGTAWDLTDSAIEGEPFTQLPFNVYRALRNTVIGDLSMGDGHRLAEVNLAQLQRWISIAIAQEFVTAAASGSYGLLNTAAKVTGVTGADALAAATDEFTQLAGATKGLVHLPSMFNGSFTGSWLPGIWGDQVAASDRLFPVADAGYQLDFMRNRLSYGATSIVGFVTGPVYLGMNGPVSTLTEESLLTENVIEVLTESQAILVFNPLTVVAFVADEVPTYSVTASPVA